MTTESKPPLNLPDFASLTDAEKADLAAAYLDLLGLMTHALHECETPVGFFWWNGRGFEITGHPPDDLVDYILREGTTARD